MKVPHHARCIGLAEGRAPRVAWGCAAGISAPRDPWKSWVGVRARIVVCQSSRRRTARGTLRRTAASVRGWCGKAWTDAHSTTLRVVHLQCLSHRRCSRALLCPGELRAAKQQECGPCDRRVPHRAEVARSEVPCLPGLGLRVPVGTDGHARDRSSPPRAEGRPPPHEICIEGQPSAGL